MRFFVSCFGGAGDPTAATKPVVPPPSRNLRHSKSHWRPALGSISEDTAPPHKERKAAAAARNFKKNENSNTAKAHRRRYSEDSDHRPVSMPRIIIPAFSPTPFMF